MRREEPLLCANWVNDGVLNDAPAQISGSPVNSMHESRKPLGGTSSLSFWRKNALPPKSVASRLHGNGIHVSIAGVFFSLVVQKVMAWYIFTKFNRDRASVWWKLWDDGCKPRALLRHRILVQHSLPAKRVERHVVPLVQLVDTQGIISGRHLLSQTVAKSQRSCLQTFTMRIGSPMHVSGEHETG